MTRFVLLAGLIVGCSDEEVVVEAELPELGAAPTVVVGDLEDDEESPAARAAPSHGGDVVLVGDTSVEVVVHEGGHVYAYPPSGEFADADIVVRVPVVEGSPRRVPLRWNAGRGRFEGRVRRVEVAPGPVAVVFDHHGHHYDADVRIRLRPAIRVEIEGPRIEGPRIRIREGKHRGKHRGKYRGRGRGHGMGMGMDRGRGPGIDIRIR